MEVPERLSVLDRMKLPLYVTLIKSVCTLKQISGSHDCVLNNNLAILCTISSFSLKKLQNFPDLMTQYCTLAFYVPPSDNLQFYSFQG